MKFVTSRKKRISVVYYSLTGNTKNIAEIIARESSARLFPLNHMTIDGTRNIEEENKLMDIALNAVHQSDFVFIGTPTQFRRPIPNVEHFAAHMVTKGAAIFCTHFGLLGSTIIDLHTCIRQNNIPVSNPLSVIIRNKEDIDNHRSQLNTFIENSLSVYKNEIIQKNETVCGKDCTMCNEYQSGKCQGAHVKCSSKQNCIIFNCCIFEQNLPNYHLCPQKETCMRRKNFLELDF
jgi:flavodoxin